MKSKYYFKNLVLLFFIVSFSSINGQIDNPKQKFIGGLTKDVEAIFDGEVVKTGESFYGTDNNIYTEIYVKVKKVNYGSVAGETIVLAKLGGTIDGKESIVFDAGKLYRGNTTFFVYSTFKVQNEDSQKSIPLVSQVGFDKKHNIIGNDKIPFANYKELFEEINRVLQVTFEQHPFGK